MLFVDTDDVHYDEWWLQLQGYDQQWQEDTNNLVEWGHLAKRYVAHVVASFGRRPGVTPTGRMLRSRQRSVVGP